MLQNPDIQEEVAEVLNNKLNNTAHSFTQETVDSWQTSKIIICRVQADKVQLFDNKCAKKEKE